METPLSKTQIDRLGDRLKKDVHTDSDLQLLDDYRRSFAEAYEAVVQTIREGGQSPTGRLAKSTLSIVEKLHRESIRLSQMQDIAGCRIVVADVLEQDRIVAWLRGVFPKASVVDRRDNPSHGYRAVHIIPEVSGKPIEIQIRSALQHLWAELSEKSSDVLDPTIKYGGGFGEWRKFLIERSEEVADIEGLDRKLAPCMDALENHLDAEHDVEVASIIAPKVQELQRLRDSQRNEIANRLQEMIAIITLIDSERRKK
ncbi:MAG: RelA/SpoT domain-containing protein [Pirellulales bacterium]|nr:RelA/SpoT domain-containing protein [Pirellulales bacterium]